MYSTLCHNGHAIPIGFCLYLPQSWVDDEQRCQEAGVPDEFIEFHRKQDLAAQLVIEARVHGAQFEWVGTDAFYSEAWVNIKPENGAAGITTWPW